MIQELREADVQVLLVAFDVETETGLPPCSNDYVAKVRDDYPDTVLQASGSVDPWKGEIALSEAERAITELGLIGFISTRLWAVSLWIIVKRSVCRSCCSGS